MLRVRPPKPVEAAAAAAGGAAERRSGGGWTGSSGSRSTANKTGQLGRDIERPTKELQALGMGGALRLNWENKETRLIWDLISNRNEQTELRNEKRDQA